MARFGVTVERDGWSCFRVPAGAAYRNAGDGACGGGRLGASYFLAAGAIGGGPVRVEGRGASDSIQGDVRFADALESLGARITWGSNWIEARAPASGRSEGVRSRSQSHSGCRDDARRRRPLRRRPVHACGTSRAGGSRRPTVSLRWRPSFARSAPTCVEGADHLRVTPPEPAQCRHPHVRRSPDGDVPRARHPRRHPASDR
jgi:3-phosphoshikimate 1-carboxyvinyltransferase